MSDKPTWMATPWQRYDGDAQFRQLVDFLIAFLFGAEFTPSELRQAVILASIKHDELRVERSKISPDAIAAGHLRALELWLHKEIDREKEIDADVTELLENHVIAEHVPEFKAEKE